MSCIFCAIVSGAAPASRVFEDERCLAFMDIHPLGDGHVLIVPRQHAVQITELDADLSVHLFDIAQRILRAQRDLGLGQEGSHVLLNDGKAANQKVPHVHVHVIPRLKGDALGTVGRLALHLTGVFGRAAARSKLEAQADQLRQRLVSAPLSDD